MIGKETYYIPNRTEELLFSKPSPGKVPKHRFSSIIVTENIPELYRSVK